MANAFAILHETRFLPQYNLHVVSNDNPESQNLKQKAAGLLLAARYMRFFDWAELHNSSIRNAVWMIMRMVFT